jgi:hypothetical protein
MRKAMLAVFVMLLITGAFAQSPTYFVSKLGMDMDVRSGGRVLEDQLAANPILLPDPSSPVTGLPVVSQIQFRGGNVQSNNPSGDYTQIFAGFRPFVRATQSEVSSAAFGRNIVVTYNDSAGIHVSPSGPGLVVDQVMISGYAASNDGGVTWTKGFMPPIPSGGVTYGDPSIGVDRWGNFYFASLSATAAHGAIQVNKSTDGGTTWSAGVLVQEDDASDKEWLAVGPDPAVKSRDNVYVTWTSFQASACELRFGRSTDGGATFTAKTIYVPTSNANPTYPQNCLTFSNPVVDPITGYLYVPFLHFSNADQDFVQMMISKDGGDTFSFATFNVAGAPDTTVMPVTQPGELTSCGTNNVRATIHTSFNAGAGQFGLPRYVNASRMTLQPAAAARNDVVYLAWSNSESLSYGAAASTDVWFVRSSDGGQTWSQPTVVNPSGTTDTQHVLPALAIDKDSNDVHISYYTQHSNGTMDLDMANSHDGGATFPANRTVRVTSTSFNLEPSNIPLSNAPNYSATNFDRQIAVCYALGEYQSVTTANGAVYSAWGDGRNLMTEPVNALDPISGQTHSQMDVFFQKVKAQ